MDRQKLATAKAKLVGRVLDIADEHLASDGISEAHTRELLMLNMAHGILSKEWEQCQETEYRDKLVELIGKIATRWREMTAQDSMDVEGVRLQVLADLADLYRQIELNNPAEPGKGHWRPGK